MLIDAPALHARLGDPDLRVFDATMTLTPRATPGPYLIGDGRDGYRAGHVPGAAYADVRALSDPASGLAFTVPGASAFAAAAGALGIGDGCRVVVYSQDSPMWATRVWWLLRHFGFDAVEVLDGGLRAWVDAGLPLEDGEHAHAPATFDVRPPRAAMLARRDDVLDVVDGRASGCLVNALKPEMFRGEEQGSADRPGHIPGSVNHPWNTVLDPATGRFRTPAELTTVLEPLLAADAPAPIAYCGGGIAATVDLFALALAGRDDGRLYDGSLREWSADPALPLQRG